MSESSGQLDHPSGFVYALSNPSMPGLYKLGQTSRSPHLRAVELSTSTAVAAPYRVLTAIFVRHRIDAEAAIHRAFHTFRLSNDREFFRFPSDGAMSAAFIDLFLRTGPAFLVDSRGQITEEEDPGTLAAFVDGLGVANLCPDLIERLHRARDEVSRLESEVTRLRAGREGDSKELEDLRARFRTLEEEFRRIRAERDHLVHQHHMEAKVGRIVQWCAEHPSEKVYVLRDLLAAGKP